MVDIEFMETGDTAKEGGTVVSKVSGRFYIATGGVTLRGRGVTNLERVVKIRGGLNDMIQRSIRFMVVGGNISW